jgi:hypothetical protein
MACRTQWFAKGRNGIGNSVLQKGDTRSMDGIYEAGWYTHPTLGLIKIDRLKDQWVYYCYAEKGHKPLSRQRPLDQWIWALSERRQEVI